MLKIKDNKYINWNVFSWEEIIDILKNKSHWLNNLMENWFCDYEFLINEANENKEADIILCFGENCIEIAEGEYFLVNFKSDWAYSISNLSEIEDRLTNFVEEVSNE